MSIRALDFEFYRIDLRTRFPFRYGIANLTTLPQLIVRGTFQIDGETCQGVSADGLTPKWFTKNPDTSFEDDDLPQMLRVIRHASDSAVAVEAHSGVFPWWWEFYRTQMAWAKENEIPPLLAGFGASLMECAAIDAFCRRYGISFHEALRTNAFELWIEGDFLPDRPSRFVTLRHTVGLSDPISNADVAANEAVADGLPHSLIDCIAAYGLTHFKIKISGDVQRDLERLSELSRVLPDRVGDQLQFTLDGNEVFREIAAFREAWEAYVSHPSIREMIQRSLLFVEQPLHRDVAFDRSVRECFDDWKDAPPVIIDESDSEIDSFPTAIELGYSGTSHKNCKGVLKSVSAAARVAHYREKGIPLILSAEDLVNVGPVALLQDLSVVGALGIDHVERNGHHYFAGISQFPSEIQEQLVLQHGDLYQFGEVGFAHVIPDRGRLRLDSVNDAPFGLHSIPDLSTLAPWLL